MQHRIEWIVDPDLTKGDNSPKTDVENVSAGVTGQGLLTNYINVYSTKTGYIRGCPENP